MEIKKLIWVFEQLIPIYQKAVDENWGYFKIKKNNLSYGICWASYFLLKEYIDADILRYYKNYLTNRYLFDKAKRNNYKNPIKKRLDFMKSEIPQLKKLIKQGYTHL